MTAESALKKSAPEQDKKKTVQPLGVTSMNVASSVRPDFRAIISDMNTQVSDLLRPDYWANVAYKLENCVKTHPFPVIEAIWADGSTYVRMIVMDASRLWAKVRIVELVDLDAMNAEIMEALGVEAPSLEELQESGDNYYVKYVNPQLRYCVVRASDGEYVKKNIGTKDDAQRELNDLKKSLSR